MKIETLADLIDAIMFKLFPVSAFDDAIKERPEDERDSYIEELAIKFAEWGSKWRARRMAAKIKDPTRRDSCLRQIKA